jgi:MFS family permease
VITAAARRPPTGSPALSVGQTILSTSILFACALLLVPTATKSTALPFLAASGILFGFGAVAYNITQVSFRQAICPERLQGRMTAAIRFLAWGTMPIGALLGGALGTWIGLRPALWVAAIGALFSFLPILLSPVPKLRETPEPIDEEPRTDDVLAVSNPLPQVNDTV